MSRPPPARRHHAVPGRRPVAEALRARRRLHEVLVDRRGADELAELRRHAAANGVAVRAVDRDALDDIAGGVVHQGVVATAPPFPYRRLDDVAGADLVVVLDGVTDPHNLGAIARSAEAAGAGALIVRERRSVLVTPAAEKASAGALSWLPVAVVPNIVAALRNLADAGVWSVGLAADGAEALWDAPLLEGRVALVVGAEGAGLSRLVSERVDGSVSIPLVGRMASLNASAAAAVALFEVARRRSAPSPGGSGSEGVVAPLTGTPPHRSIPGDG